MRTETELEIIQQWKKYSGSTLTNIKTLKVIATSCWTQCNVKLKSYPKLEPKYFRQLVVSKTAPKEDLLHYVALHEHG